MHVAFNIPHWLVMTAGAVALPVAGVVIGIVLANLAFIRTFRPF